MAKCSEDSAMLRVANALLVVELNGSPLPIDLFFILLRYRTSDPRARPSSSGLTAQCAPPAPHDQ